jgi:hypothetical protein
MHQGLDLNVNTYAKKGTTRGALFPQKILKIRCPRLAKNAFAIQHLLHNSIVYTFVYFCAMKMGALMIAFQMLYLQ